MNRRGTALALAVFALAVIGALVATAFQVAHLEFRAARLGVSAVRALHAAEVGATTVLAEWAMHPQLDALAVGDSITLASAALGGRAVAGSTVIRLTESLYLIRGEGTSVDAGGGLLARRLVATLVRRGAAGMTPLAQRSWVSLY